MTNVMPLINVWLLSAWDTMDTCNKLFDLLTQAGAEPKKSINKRTITTNKGIAIAQADKILAQLPPDNIVLYEWR